MLPNRLLFLAVDLRAGHRRRDQQVRTSGFAFLIQTDAHNDRKYDIIPLLTDVAQAAVKEKVIRVILSTFRGLVTKAPAANLPAMLVAQLLPFVKNLSTRKWSDEDIVEDVQFLRDELSARFESLTCVVFTWGVGFDHTHPF